MSLSHTLRIALRALRRNQLRSFLTGLGIIIGVGAVIALVSIGHGAKARIASQIADLGTNLIMISPGSYERGGVRSGWGGRASLRPGDAEALFAVPGVIGVSAEVRSRSQVFGGGRNWNTMILGESPDYPYLRNWVIDRGAMFTPEDVQRIAKVAVVGQTVIDQLYVNGEDPLNQIIRIRNIPFRIVGTLAPKGFNLNGQDQDDVIIIPYSSHLRRIARRDYVDSIIAQVDDTEEISGVEQEIADLLAARHRLGDAPPDFTIRTQLDLLERASATTDTMTLLLSAIAAVSLLVGGIGIMNIMLVSVAERTREIGIRIAIGAHDRDVMRQFLLEAIILSSTGGLLGVIVGAAGSKLVAALNGWPVMVSPESVVIALVFSAGVGIVFGYFPARHAAQLHPIEALRFE